MELVADAASAPLQESSTEGVVGGEGAHHQVALLEGQVVGGGQGEALHHEVLQNNGALGVVRGGLVVAGGEEGEEVGGHAGLREAELKVGVEPGVGGGLAQVELVPEAEGVGGAGAGAHGANCNLGKNVRGIL